MSKFKDILKAAGKTSPETQGDLPSSTPDSTPSVRKDTQQAPEASPNVSPKPEPPKRGRPKAKRSDPHFTQISAYIRKDTHRKVKMKLLEIESEQDLSELIEELLRGWLRQPD